MQGLLLLTLYLCQATARNDARIQSSVYYLLQVTFESVSEVLEHGRSARKNNILRMP